MDNILAGQSDNHRLVDGNVQLIDRGDIILGIRICPVEPDGVFGRNELDISAAKSSIRARIVGVLIELFPDNPNHESLFFRRKRTNAFCPEGERQAHEDNDFKQSNSTLNIV